MEPAQDFKSLQDSVTSTLVSTTRTAGQIASEDLGFHRSFNPSFGASLDTQNARLLSLANSLIRVAVAGSNNEALVLEDADDVDDRWEKVVDVVDTLLEMADICLDEYTGVIKRQSHSNSESVS